MQGSAGVAMRKTLGNSSTVGRSLCRSLGDVYWHSSAKALKVAHDCCAQGVVLRPERVELSVKSLAVLLVGF